VSAPVQPPGGVTGGPQGVPGPEQEFKVPPNWPAPAGFDPRKGHLVDPTWPAPPPDWQFWGKREAPGGLGNLARRVGFAPLFAVLVVIIIVANISAHSHDVGSPKEGVGSCWYHKGDKAMPVDCGSSKAKYKVIAHAATDDDCPPSTEAYLDSKPGGVDCLAPLG